MPLNRDTFGLICYLTKRKCLSKNNRDHHSSNLREDQFQVSVSLSGLTPLKNRSLDGEEAEEEEATWELSPLGRAQGERERDFEPLKDTVLKGRKGHGWLEGV